MSHMPSQDNRDNESTLVAMFDDLLQLVASKNAEVFSAEDTMRFADLDAEISERCAKHNIDIPSFAVREPGIRLVGFVRLPYNRVTAIEYKPKKEGEPGGETAKDESIIVYNLRTWVDAIRAAREAAEEAGA